VDHSFELYGGVLLDNQEDFLDHSLLGSFVIFERELRGIFMLLRVDPSNDIKMFIEPDHVLAHMKGAILFVKIAEKDCHL